MMFNNVSSNNKELELTIEQLKTVLEYLRPDIKITKNTKGYRAGKYHITHNWLSKHGTEDNNVIDVVASEQNLNKKESIKLIKNILNIGSNCTNEKFIKKDKPTPAPAINIDIDKKALNVFYNFLNDKFSHDEKTQKEYKKLYYKKRELELSNDFLPLLPEYLKEFRAEKYNEYQKLKGLIPYWEYRLIQFHRDFNNNIDYFTGYLFDSHYEKYSNKKYEYKKSNKPSGITSKTYGRNSLFKLSIKGGLFFIVESVDKAEALIQLGYSAIGLNGIGSYTALESALNEILAKIKSDKLKAIILLDSKKEINTPENNSIEKIAGMLENLDISYSIAEIEKPKIGSNIKDFDINDKFLNKDNTAREKYIKKLLSKTLSLKEFKQKLGKNKNLDTKNLFRTPIKARLGNKTIVEIDKKTIDEIREDKLIKLGIIEFLKDETKTYLIIKAPAGVGKTYTLLELARTKKILYLTGNTSLINDMIKDCKEKGIKAHYQKSNRNLCKDNHDKNQAPIDKNSSYDKFKKLNEKKLDTSKVCGNCQLKKGCMFFNKIQQFSYSDIKHNTKVVAMTTDKLINADQQTRDLIASFDPELIVIDENMSLINNLVIDKKELLLLEKYIINNTDNENIKKLFNLLKTMIKDIPEDETMQRGKELYNFFNGNYTGFKELYNSMVITDIENSIKKLELEEFLEIEDLPNKDILPEFLRALKNKCENMVILNDNFQISTKKKLVLPTNKKVVHLDATANLTLFSKDLDIPEDKISLLELKGYNPQKEVYQYANSSSKNTALKKGNSQYENIVCLIKENVLDKNLIGFVVVSKELENKMKEDPNLKECLLTGRLFIEHHYNLRGRNDFKDCDFCIVTAPKVNYKIVETMAYTLYGITDFELVHDTIQSNIYDKNSNSYLKLENSRVYKNPEMNDFLKKFQQDEIYQDINRIDRTGNQKKQVYIFDQIDMTGLIYENIQSYNFNTERKKNKSISDPLVIYLKELLESSKENSPFILLNDLLDIFVKSDKKNKNYSLDIAETLINIREGKFSYNIYNLITNLTVPNIDSTFDEKTFKKALKTAMYETGFKEKNISLCFDEINYTTLNCIYFDNDIFSSCESILKEKFKFIPIEKVTAPALAIPEIEIIKKERQFIMKNVLEHKTKEIVLSDNLIKLIATNFYYKEVTARINLNITIDNNYFFYIHDNCYSKNHNEYRKFLKENYSDLIDSQLNEILDIVFILFSKNRNKINNFIKKQSEFIDLDQPSLTKYDYENIPEDIFLKANNNFELFKDTRINSNNYVNFDYILSIDKWQREDSLNSNKRVLRELFFEKLLNGYKEINEIIDKKILKKSVLKFLSNIDYELVKCQKDIIEYNLHAINDNGRINFEVDFKFLETYLLECRFNLCVRLTSLDNDFNNLHKVYSNLDYWHFFMDYLKGFNDNKNKSYESLILYLYTYYRLNYENTEQPKNTISLD